MSAFDAIIDIERNKISNRLSDEIALDFDLPLDEVYDTISRIMEDVTVLLDYNDFDIVQQEYLDGLSEEVE